nr:LLM class flavin-dependent oxidoreductase [Actinomycetota bacterium]
IDAISGGRLEMGIGAGWYEHEYDGYGYEFPKPAVRIGMLREGVEIMRRMWTEDVVDYEGTYYTLKGALCQPKPVQEPHIPLWIAGGGEQLTLNVAARYADYTNFAGSFENFSHKSEVLAKHCRDVGRDFDEITRTSNFNIILGETEAHVEEKKAWFVEHYRKFLEGDAATNAWENNFQAWGGIAGTPEQVTERLSKLKDAGLAYGIIFFQEVAYDRSGLELFAQKVIPELQ